MKIHRTLTEAVASALASIFNEGRHADKVIEHLLKSNPKWGSRDRAFLASNTYEVVRWWRLLAALSMPGAWPRSEWDRPACFLLLGANLLQKGVELPDWPEFRGLEAASIAARRAALLEVRRVVQSVPDWMDEMAASELGASAWESEIQALNRQADVVIRANTLKTDVEKLSALLAADGLVPLRSQLSHTALILKQRSNVFQMPAFQQGFFEVQDDGSQCIAPFLRPEPGMRVVDACAGAGGKTLHLAALMENRGQLIALDTHAWKLDELRRRARRNGAHIVDARPITSGKVIKRLHGTADRLLLDVPCSGLGTLRRNPDAKWKLSPAFLDEVRATQANILRDYSKMLRPGGLMVYATCSILPSENEGQVAQFLNGNSDFQLVEQRHILPSQHGSDGFFMALLSRHDK